MRGWCPEELSKSTWDNMFVHWFQISLISSRDYVISENDLRTFTIFFKTLVTFTLFKKNLFVIWDWWTKKNTHRFAWFRRNINDNTNFKCRFDGTPANIDCPILPISYILDQIPTNRSLLLLKVLLDIEIDERKNPFVFY